MIENTLQMTCRYFDETCIRMPYEFETFLEAIPYKVSRKAGKERELLSKSFKSWESYPDRVMDSILVAVVI